MNKTLLKQLTSARQAARSLALLPTAKKNAVLKSLAKILLAHQKAILLANTKDLAAVPPDYPLRDRLTLTPERLEQICASIVAVTKLPDPIGELLETNRRPSGITVQRVRVPFGVIGVIYEARPNVTTEVVSLCLKTGNAVVLKGGKDAFYTNTTLIHLIQKTLRQHNINSSAIQLIDPRDRTITEQLLQAHGYVDVLIPRGGNNLIQYVREHATIPVIETGAGVCHTYVEKTANLKQAVDIAVNAKTRRCTVCNTLDCLVVDKAITKTFLPPLAKALAQKQVLIYADPASYTILKKLYPPELLAHATTEHYGKEFLSLTLSIKTVRNSAEALQFIQDHTSGHSEAIITQNKKLAQQFTQTIDAAAVYVNTSTAFTDGFEFGLGAEIGISTQKLHARGPMGLKELTTYKWVVTSEGKTRN